MRDNKDEEKKKHFESFMVLDFGRIDSSETRGLKVETRHRWIRICNLD